MKRLLPAVLGLMGSAMLAVPALAAEEAPDVVAAWDRLWHEVLIDLYVLGGIFMVAAIYMLFKYRAKSPEDVGTAKELSTAASISWVLIPAAIFMADDFFLAANGWALWNLQRRVPDNAMEVKVIGYQWYWEFEYEDGTTTEELVVPVGTPVVLRMTSEDVIHSFGMTDYRVTEDVMPGRITYVWFNPVEPKETVVTCREFCGDSHTTMYTDVRAVPEDEFEAWLKEQADS